MKFLGWFALLLGFSIFIWANSIIFYEEGDFWLESKLSGWKLISILIFCAILIISSVNLLSSSFIRDDFAKYQDDMKRIIGIPEELIPEVKIHGDAQECGASQEVTPVYWNFNGRLFENENDANQARQEYIQVYGKKGG